MVLKTLNKEVSISFCYNNARCWFLEYLATSGVSWPADEGGGTSHRSSTVTKQWSISAIYYYYLAIMSSTQSYNRFTDEKYKNWLKTTESLYILRSRIQNFIEKETETYHNSLRNNPKLSRQPCESRCKYANKVNCTCQVNVSNRKSLLYLLFNFYLYIYPSIYLTCCILLFLLNTTI